MKSFLVLLLFFFVLSVFLNGAVSQIDLTPDTPSSAPAEPAFNVFDTGEGEFPLRARGVDGQSAGAPSAAGGSGSGSCRGAYTVSEGETLFQISRRCGISIEELLRANPMIVDPDLIYAGQVIYLDNLSPLRANEEAVPAAASSVTAAVQPTVDPFWTEAAPATPTAEKPPAAPVAPVSTPAEKPVSEGAAPADPFAPAVTAELQPAGALPNARPKVAVRAVNFSPMTRVSIELVKVGGQSPIAGESRTDARGSVTMDIAIPPDALPGEEWLAAVRTLDGPAIEAQSAPFVIP